MKPPRMPQPDQTSFTQPFGHAPTRLRQAVQPPRFVSFGSSFIFVYGMTGIAVILLALLRTKADSEEIQADDLASTVLVLTGAGILIYAICSGVLSIFGNVIGLFMALPMVVLGVAGNLYGFRAAKGGGSIVGLLISVLFVVGAYRCIKQYYAYRAWNAAGQPVSPPQSG